MAYLDRVVTEAGGVALRYGGFYGSPDDQLARAVRERHGITHSFFRAAAAVTIAA